MHGKCEGEANQCETIRRPCSLLSSRRFRAVTERHRFRTSYGEGPAYKYLSDELDKAPSCEERSKTTRGTDAWYYHAVSE